MTAGRPSKYKADYCEEAYGLSLLGYTDLQLAEYFEVEEKTLNNWKKAHPEFLHSLKDGKDKADQKVVDALYQKALSGDTTAMIFWLKNRQRYSWRDKINHEVSGQDGKPIEAEFKVTFVE